MPTIFAAGSFEPPVANNLVQGITAYDQVTAPTATLASTATSGNLLVVAYFWASRDGAAPALPAAPAGYTQLYSFTGGPGGSESNFSLFYKISDGTETAVTLGAIGGLLFWEVSGVNTVTPITTSATNTAFQGTGIRAPATGTIAVTPSNAVCLGVYAYNDNDHGGSTSNFQGLNDNGDFYIGQVGAGGEDFHMFMAWTEVSDSSAQFVTFTPNNTGAERVFGSIFVVNLDAAVDEQPTILEMAVTTQGASSDSSANATPEAIGTTLAPVSSDSSANAAPLSTQGDFAALSSDSSTNVSPLGVLVTLTSVNEDDPVVDESGVTPIAINITPAALSSTSSINVSPEVIAAALVDLASDSSASVSPESLQVTLTTINETVELTVQNIVDGIFAHEIDGYRVDDILRILFAVAAGDVSQQVNGSYTIFKPLSTQERLTGDPAANNGRDVTSIDVTP